MRFRTGPGFLATLQSQLEKLPYQVIESISDARGLEIQSLIRLLLRPQDHSVDCPEPSSSPLIKFEDADEDVFNLGLDAIEAGQVAYCMLAGADSVSSTKALWRIPGLGLSLLGLKLTQSVPCPHVWVMTSPANDEAIKSHVASLAFRGNVKTFQQYQSVRLTPDNQLYLEEDSPRFYPCGHGDAIPALRGSGLLDSFLSQGGKYIVFVNVNNIMARLEPSLVGQHIKSGRPVTCEVVDRLPTDAGGVLCDVGGVDQIVEEFRITGGVDMTKFSWLNTNSMTVDANLTFDEVRWSWHRTKRNVEGKLVVQYERLLQDLTSTFQTSYIASPRHSRYMPVRTVEDLRTVHDLLNGNA